MNYINIYVNYLKEKFLVQQVLQIQFFKKILNKFLIISCFDLEPLKF